MKITMKCPYCKKDMEYFEDKDCEELGYYAFDCKVCKNAFMTPQDSPLIKRFEIIEE